jgi:hypothetical protein
MFSVHSFRTRFLLLPVLLFSLVVINQPALGRKKERVSKEEQAAVLRAVAMKYFDVMDEDKSGVLSQSEISRALKKKRIDPADVPTIKWMRDRMGDIGHVVRVDVISMANVVGPTVISIPRPTPVYGISKDDLLMYGLSKEQRKEMEKEKKQVPGQAGQV